MGKEEVMAENPDEIRRKLVLLEGDRKAFYESSQAEIQKNKDDIDAIRKENKSLHARIKSLKAPSALPSGPKAITLMDNKIAEQIKKHNTLRYQVQSKHARLLELQKQMDELEQEEESLAKSKDGDSPEAQRLRELENRLEKATIKAQEAQHIGRTYEQIITKLQQDRLTFDGKIDALEKTKELRKADLTQLQSMHADACASRDKARKELQTVEQECQAARAEREQEKKRLSALAEERRRQYEAMEKRLRLQSVGNFDNEEFDMSNDDIKKKALSYEEAMQQIKDATGVSNVQEVYDRFQSQGQTMEHLSKLRDENRKKVADLREEHVEAQKHFENQQYSGETRNTSNQRMMREFENHLKSVEHEYEEAKESDAKYSQVLVKIKAGVDSLFEKLDILEKAENADPQNAKEKLAEARLRLVKLIEHLDAKKEELPTQMPIMTTLPENNTRIQIPDATTTENDNSDSEDDEVISRDAMKRTAQNLIESRNAKPKKGKGRRRP